MSRRATGLAAVGIVAGGALALTVAAPAQAVDVAPLSSYMLTVPPSVYSAAAGYSTTEQAAWREVARAGVDPKPPTVPVSPSTGWGITAGIQALWLGGMAVVQNAGTLGTVFGVSPDQLSDRYAEQGLTAAEGFQCESLEGDFLGDFFTGVNDWFQSLFGVDCAAMRDGELEKNPDWEPLAPISSAQQYPFSILSNGVTITFGTPQWSTALWQPAAPAVQRQEGWVIPVLQTGNGTAESSARIYPSLITSTGLSDPDATAPVLTRTLSATNLSTASCGGVVGSQCLVLDKYFRSTTGMPSGWATGDSIAGILSTRITGSTARVPVAPLPYVNPRTGSGVYAPAGQEQVFLTTVETADGNTYQCRTAPFLETDADVPTPCDPAIPSGQWEVSRTVEMIPASTGTWTVGSDPRRVMTDQQTPSEYQDWRQDYPECSNKVCKLDLIKVGVGSCFALGDACNGWASDPNRASNYTCTYNGQTTSMSECEAGYPNVFSQTSRDLGQAYPQPNDPATGAPSTGGQTSTTAGPVTAPGSAVLPPNQPRNCFPTGWNAFNPFEWVYQPVRCVLEWAFVPRTQYVDQQAKTIQAKWTGSSLVSLLVVLEDGRDMVLGATGCAGPAVNINIYGASYSGNPLSACASPMAEVAGFSRWFTFAAAWVMCIATVARSIGGVVGFTKLGGD